MRSSELPSAIHEDIEQSVASGADPVAAAWSAFRGVGASDLSDAQPESYDMFQVEGRLSGGPDWFYDLTFRRVTFVYEQGDHVGEIQTMIEVLLPDVGLQSVLENVEADSPGDLSAFFARWEASDDASEIARHADRAGHPRVLWTDLRGGGGVFGTRGLPKPPTTR